MQICSDGVRGVRAKNVLTGYDGESLSHCHSVNDGWMVAKEWTNDEIHEERIRECDKYWGEPHFDATTSKYTGRDGSLGGLFCPTRLFASASETP